jgi:hypothetical protein
MNALAHDFVLALAACTSVDEVNGYREEAKLRGLLPGEAAAIAARMVAILAGKRKM